MIRHVTGGRHSGKTTAAIREANRTGSYLVCKNRREVDLVMSRPRGERPEQSPLTFKEFTAGEFDTYECRGFVIDDADLFLRILSRGALVYMITMNEDGNDE